MTANLDIMVIRHMNVQWKKNTELSSAMDVIVANILISTTKLVAKIVQYWSTVTVLPTPAAVSILQRHVQQAHTQTTKQHHPVTHVKQEGTTTKSDKLLVKIIAMLGHSLHKIKKHA